MTQAKAIGVATAIINAGFQAHAVPDPNTPGQWLVRARSNALDVDVATAATLATNQGVVGKIAEIEYS